MGDPKKPRKKFVTPRNPWDETELLNELRIIGEYGLRNKRELWRASTELSRIRGQARKLLATQVEEREKVEKQLLLSLEKYNLLTNEKSLDTILNLTVNDILNRRLQTIVWKMGIARTPYEARQLIVHKHVMVGDKIINKPSYLVKGSEEGLIKPLIELKDEGATEEAK